MQPLALPARLPRRSAMGLFDLLLPPPRCLGCGGSVGGDGELRPECWRGIDFLAPPDPGAGRSQRRHMTETRGLLDADSFRIIRCRMAVA